jgi:hypothetical protein
MKDFQELINQINAAITATEIEIVSSDIGDWLQAGTEEQKIALRTAVSQLNARLGALSTKALAQAEQYLMHNGKQFPLADWLTPKEYARRFNVRSTQVITNWISRGIIPKENTVTIQELNNLTLVKAVPYRA